MERSSRTGWEARCENRIGATTHCSAVEARPQTTRPHSFPFPKEFSHEKFCCDAGLGLRDRSEQRFERFGVWPVRRRLRMRAQLRLCRCVRAQLRMRRLVLRAELRLRIELRLLLIDAWDGQIPTRCYATAPRIMSEGPFFYALTVRSPS